MLEIKGNVVLGQDVEAPMEGWACLKDSQSAVRARHIFTIDVAGCKRDTTTVKLGGLSWSRQRRYRMLAYRIKANCQETRCLPALYVVMAIPLQLQLSFTLCHRHLSLTAQHDYMELCIATARTT